MADTALRGRRRDQDVNFVTVFDKTIFTSM